VDGEVLQVLDGVFVAPRRASRRMMPRFPMARKHCPVTCGTPDDCADHPGAFDTRFHGEQTCGTVFQTWVDNGYAGFVICAEIKRGVGRSDARRASRKRRRTSATPRNVRVQVALRQGSARGDALPHHLRRLRAHGPAGPCAEINHRDGKFTTLPKCYFLGPQK